jgi:hypothetical protein
MSIYSHPNLKPTIQGLMDEPKTNKENIFTNRIPAILHGEQTI